MTFIEAASTKQGLQSDVRHLCEVLSDVAADALRRITLTLSHKQLRDNLIIQPHLFRTLDDAVLRLRVESFTCAIHDVKANRVNECSAALMGACPLLSRANLLSIEFHSPSE